MTVDPRFSRPSRFVDVTQRDERSDVPPDVWRAATERYEQVTWRGIHLDKSPFEFALYPMLIFREQIASVIELGAGTGGSAVWLADQLALFDRAGGVISLDRDLDQLHPAARRHPGVDFVHGDCARLQDALSEELLARLPHPWLVIEDAHEGVCDALDFLHQHGLQAGDYIIVEDTNVALWQGWRDWPDEAFIARMLAKGREVTEWLVATGGVYRIDTLYQDMFGHNASKAANSILRRMKNVIDS